MVLITFSSLRTKPHFVSFVFMWTHLSVIVQRRIIGGAAHVLPRTASSVSYLSKFSTFSKRTAFGSVAKTFAVSTRTTNFNPSKKQSHVRVKNQENNGDDFFADFDEWEKENRNKKGPAQSSPPSSAGGIGRREGGRETDRFNNNNNNRETNNFQRFEKRSNDFSPRTNNRERSNSDFSPRSNNRERGNNDFSSRPNNRDGGSFQRYDNRKGDFNPRSSGRDSRPPFRQEGDRRPRRPSTGAGYVIDGNNEGTYDNNRERRPPRNQSFRENFAGTRVFVQNLPEDITWQELKDHFRVAGSVVFASVSADPVTRASKGCGIVQYETTDMAQNAISIMKDHPLRGISLFVREDVQERREDSGRASRGSSVASWTCADEENSAFLSAEVRSEVESLISSRDQARRQRDYETSDDIRDELKTKYNVHVDDKMKAWWYSVDETVPKRVAEMKGEGRWGDKAVKQWRQVPTTPDSDACVNADLVDDLLNQRDIARKERNYSLADSLLEQARTSPENSLTLRIHDESRTWRVWTDDPPPKEIYEKRNFRKTNAAVSETDEESMQTSDDEPIESDSMPKKEVAKRNAADLCIEILEKHDPSKIDEVKKLLAAFPGREGNILQKIKQNFNVADE